MDFSFTEEQQMLLDTTRRFIAKDYGFELRRQIKEKAPDGYSREVWRALADIGLLSLNVPEANGGLGGSAIDTMLVMTAVGEGLLLEPYLSSAVLATRTIATLGTPAQRESWLPVLAAGERIAVLAHDEPQTRFDRLAVSTRAWRVGDGYLLTGHKSVVAHGGSADLLLVTARIGGAGEEGPLAVFCLPGHATGMHKVAYATVDGVRACDLWFNQCFVSASDLLGTANGDAEQALGDVLDYGLAALCAEAVGALDKLLAATVEYARNRKQFGQPIGKFQALQHRMADMYIHLEQARSMALLAAVKAEAGDPHERRRAVSAAKYRVGQAMKFVGQQAVQLHGGMGVTNELPAAHHFKRLSMIELTLGDSDHHLQRFIAQGEPSAAV